MIKKAGMGKKVCCLLGLFLFGTVALVSGQQYQIVEETYFPKQFYVGDKVRLRLIIKTALVLDTKLRPRYSSSQWLDLDQVRVSPGQGDGNEYEVLVDFSSYLPGLQPLPEIRMGELLLSGLKIHTQSLLPLVNPKLSEPAPQVLLPGTIFFIIFTLFILAAIPLLFFSLPKFLGKPLARAAQRWQADRNYRDLMGTLSFLTKNRTALSERDFYIGLGEALRRYLSRRTGEDFINITVGEMQTREYPFLKDGGKGFLALLKQGDWAKFRGRGTESSGKGEHILQVQDLARQTESYFRKPKSRERAAADKPRGQREQ